MKKASITEAKNRLSALIDEVRHGKSVLITDRGRPVARLESVLSEPSGDDEGRLARLERQGVLRRALAPPPKDLANARLPRLKGGASLLEMILRERREGR
jgi:prevent-host-death family protein